MRVDNNIQKLDTVSPEYINKVDRPTGRYDVDEIIAHLKSFHGHVIIQTIFMHGHHADNTSDDFVVPWLEAIKQIAPQQVMIYTIDRETPDLLLRRPPTKSSTRSAPVCRPQAFPARHPTERAKTNTPHAYTLQKNIA
jgi:wyosine [tRNA(Phe)-imidazoG37] synthetase (radical SAM superfamily)